MTPTRGLFLCSQINNSVVKGTRPIRGFPCIGNRTYRESRTNVATSGGYGKNYGTWIKTVKRQETREKNGLSALQNLVKWLVRKSAQTLGITVYGSNIYCSCVYFNEVYLRTNRYNLFCCSSMGS